MKIELFDERFVHVVWDDSLLHKPCFYADNISRLIKHVKDNDTLFKGAITKSDDDDYPFIALSGEDYRFAYYDPNYKFKRAYNEGKIVQYKDASGDWHDCVPNWILADTYRVKPAKYYVGIGDQGALTYCSNSAPYKRIYASFDNTTDAIEWIDEHRKFVPVMRAFEKGLAIEYKRKGDQSWYTAQTPAWDPQLRYRVKPKSKRRMTNRELAKWLADGNGQKATINGTAVTCHNYELNADDKPVDDCMIRGWNETEWHEPEVEQ